MSRRFHITIIAVGKLHHPGLEKVAHEYEKRLGPYATLEIIELPECPFRNIDEKMRTLQKEAAAIEKRLVKMQGMLIALDLHGKALTSEAFAQFLEQQSSGGEHLIFLIGGPLGIDPALLEKAHLKLSLSPMTFPHQLARVVLLEQLFRATTIILGKKYHY